MAPWILREGALEPSLLEDFAIANDFVARLPDATAEIAPSTARRSRKDQAPYYEWTCHGVARALCGLLSEGWMCLDGWFGSNGFEHAWLYKRTAHRAYILDAYPIGTVGGPILVDASVACSPWLLLYIERRMNYSAAEIDRFDREGQEALRAYRAMTTDLQKVEA